MKYIHYGSNCFDPSKFVEIKNEKYFNKPVGGLWASNIDAKFGWKEWCQGNDYGSGGLKNLLHFHYLQTPEYTK